jgi:hypothetical protein
MTQDEKFLKMLHIEPCEIPQRMTGASASACPRCGASCGPLVRVGYRRCASCGNRFRLGGAQRVQGGRIEARAIDAEFDGDEAILSREDFTTLVASNNSAVNAVERLSRRLRWHRRAWVGVAAGIAGVVWSVLRG